MNTAVAGGVPGRLARLLSLLSVACFWLLPLSPMIAIAAVSMTKGVSGWSRKLAVTGAALCIAYTVVMACLTIRVALQVRL
jgi:ABC-type sulfate transport system permease subunit